MAILECKICGKKRSLSKKNEEALLLKNDDDIEKVKKNYICRDCKKKAKVKKE
jgi:hypothetical protein